MKTKKIIAIIIVFGLVGAFVGYSIYNRDKNISGTIKVSGAFALYPMMVKWSEEFRKLYPNVTIEVSAGGAGKGMTDALNELVNIGMISRQIYPEEEAQGAYYVAVTKDAVVPTINANNPVLSDILNQGISMQTFYNIYIAGNVTTWGQVVGRPEITNKIQVYTRSDSCGASDTWALYLGGKKQVDLKGVAIYGDPGLLDAVKNDPLGIGYNNIGYAYDLANNTQVGGIKVAPIDINANGVLNSNENFYEKKTDITKAIANETYPHPPARMLYLVTKNSFTRVTLKFIRWILGDGQKYIEEQGYVQLSTTIINDQIKKLEV